MIKMQTYEIRPGVFALGMVDHLAETVVARRGNGYRGVRGRRPLLTSGRFKRVKPSARLRAALHDASAI